MGPSRLIDKIEQAPSWEEAFMARILFFNCRIPSLETIQKR